MSFKKQKTFTRYVINCLLRDFHEEDIKNGFTEIKCGEIKGRLFYKKPTDALFIVPFTRQDLSECFPKNHGNVPDIMYFV